MCKVPKHEGKLTTGVRGRKYQVSFCSKKMIDVSGQWCHVILKWVNCPDIYNTGTHYLRCVCAVTKRKVIHSLNASWDFRFPLKVITTMQLISSWHVTSMIFGQQTQSFVDWITGIEDQFFLCNIGVTIANALVCSYYLHLQNINIQGKYMLHVADSEMFWRKSYVF